MDKSCEIDGCSRKMLAKGMCASHYYTKREAERRAAIRAVDRPCIQCGGSLAGKRPNAKYCSTECKHQHRAEAQKAEYHRRRREQACRWCGAEIPLDAGNRARTCSIKCGEAWQNHVASANARTRAARRAAWEANKPPCAECGGEIPSTRRPGVKYCSPDCKKQSMDVRWRKSNPHYMRSYLYGMTAEDYAGLLEAQGNACAICGGEWTNGRPHVDHDHKTGKVRGLLCGPCNTGIGHLKDDPARLAAAITYLTR
jgi:hypothetical protein